MEYTIINFKDKKEFQESLLSYLRICDWRAGRFLAKLLTKGDFFTEEDDILFLMDDINVVSFLTLSRQDCIKDETLCPWIGFYEKYGFVYWTNRLDINSEDSRVYVYDMT